MAREPNDPATTGDDGLAVRGTPIHEYDPDDLGDGAYRAVARVLDENRAARARRQTGGARGTS